MVNQTMFQQNCKLINKEQLTENSYIFTLESDEIAGKAKPGQFVHIACGRNKSFILRRPISIHNANESNFEILFRVIGDATKSLAEVEVGDYIDVIGPLGNGFELKNNPLIIAGGMGIAPLYFLLQAFLKKDIKPTLIHGALNSKELYQREEIAGLGLDYKIATDDGSMGHKGLVTDLLQSRFQTSDLSAGRHGFRLQVYSCGPEPMLKAVAKICNENNINCQLSLERYMACGVGACLSCVCETKEGYKRVCKEGPVFKTEELKL